MRYNSEDSCAMPLTTLLVSPKYQLRLYCTSSTYYTPPTPTGFRSPGSTPCPIEFPPTCEVRVNGTQLNANLKGLKKKPGTAPPPDLGKVVRMAASSTNRVEMIYVNSQQPTPPKVSTHVSSRVPFILNGTNRNTTLWSHWSRLRQWIS